MEGKNHILEYMRDSCVGEGERESARARACVCVCVQTGSRECKIKHKDHRTHARTRVAYMHGCVNSAPL